MTKAAGKNRYGITALRRGLQLLTLVASNSEPLTATELSGLSGLHSSTVHRFLVNLESAGFLVRDSLDGGYQLGPVCLGLGRTALERMEVRKICLPYLRQLNLHTRETVHLTVRHKLSAIYVEKLDSPEPLRIFSQVGADVPLHCTGVGKVLLAYLDGADQEEILHNLVLTRFTSNTIVSLQRLQAELARVRQQGYAVDWEEHEQHIRCIAAPLWDRHSRVEAAFSLTGPAPRMNKTRFRQLIPLVKSLSREISERLGYIPNTERRAPLKTRTRSKAATASQQR